MIGVLRHMAPCGGLGTPPMKVHGSPLGGLRRRIFEE